MKFRSTLLGKVLSIAFLNLSLLGFASLLLVRHESRLDLNSFLLAPAHDRILAAMRLLALQLGQTEPGGWDSVIAAYATANRVVPRIVDDHGAVIAGDRKPLPPPVLQRFLAGYSGGERPKGRGRPRGHDDDYGLAYLGSVSGTVWVAAAAPLAHIAEPPGDRHSWIVLSSSGDDDLFYVDTKPLIAVGCAIILISVVCWLPFVRGITRSISRMTAATAQVSQGHFEIQLPVKRRDELGELGASINRMASRLDRLVNGQKRFLRDAAHELRSPLARMQVALGLLDRSAADEQRQSLVDLREDLDEMSTLVDGVLSFSRATSGAVEPQTVNVPVEPLVAQAIARESREGVAIYTSIETGLSAQGDPDLLFRALSNLLRNAIQYAGASGPIEVAARTEQDHAVVSVADQGPGVPESELDAIFDPFYRLQMARERSSGGIGLGLAIVKSSVELCGGTVVCRNRQPSGLEIEIRLKKGRSGTLPPSAGRKADR